MDSLAVDISHVRKTFGPTVALDDCSLKAYAGEVHAIIGGNGSGKSTLAKVISGVLAPDSGNVAVLGEAATNPFEARRLGIVNVFQEVMVADGCSVLDNLYLGSDGLFSASMTQEAKIAEASKLMRDLLGFDLDLHQPAGELPLSIKQWLTIARGFLSRPKVLILDESSAALDYDSTERLFGKIREMKQGGAAIMIVTHRIAELSRIADRATVLRDGTTVGTLEKEEITEAKILELVAGKIGDEPVQSQSQHTQDTEGTRTMLRAKDACIMDGAGGINLELRAGEIVGIIGLEDQGQAEFAKAVAGIEPPVSGAITVGRGSGETPIISLASARENKIAYVSGDRKKEGIFPNLSIFENQMMPIYSEHRMGGALNLIDRVKLSPIFERETALLRVKMGSKNDKITSLSGGNQQKVLIARAFSEKPDILVLNDPARGIDIGAKLDLYRNLRGFAARGNATIFLSSEAEEFLDLCSRVLVFRNGQIATTFYPPFDSTRILNAMFGKTDQSEPEVAERPRARRTVSLDGRPVPRDLGPNGRPQTQSKTAFQLESPDIKAGGVIPDQHVEDNNISPHLIWQGTPDGTKSFALSVTDPDLPPEFEFPRSFAQWLVCNIPATATEIVQGASGGDTMPGGAIELPSDYVTFGVPGYGAGYGGPWPPDRSHRYIFTLYALNVDRVELDTNADLNGFYAAIMPHLIDSASFTATYGPAKKPLPS